MSDSTSTVADRVLLVAAGSQMEAAVTAAVDSDVDLAVASDAEAIDRLHSGDVDALIVTDELAATDPPALIKRIRREFPTLPLVCISGSESGVLASDLLAAGADDYIPLSVVSTDSDRLRSGLTRAAEIRSLSEPSDELAALHTSTREMIAAASTDALAARVVAATETVLGLEYACVYSYDEQDQRLTPVAWTARLEDTAGDPPSLGPDSLAWPAFTNGSPQYYADVSTVDSTPVVSAVARTELFVPLGEHGLLTVSLPTQDALNAHEREILHILGANATAAFDAIGRLGKLQESERELQRRNEQLDQFVSVVSHDLKSPLQVAEGRLELARDEFDSEHLAAVSDAHGRMHTLIENLLRLARSEERATETESVGLASLAESCWRHVATAEATVVTDTDQRIRADRSRLSQLLENLMRNAVEHGGPDVTVTVGELDGGFYVEDDGAGIPESERDAVFEMGYSTSDEGTGFGLAIVKRITEAHGWDIRITDGVDGGTRFEITGVELDAE